SDQARHPPRQSDHARREEALQTQPAQAADALARAPDAESGSLVQPERRRAAGLGGAPAPALRRQPDRERSRGGVRQAGERGARDAGRPHLAAGARAALTSSRMCASTRWWMAWIRASLKKAQ